MTSGQKKASSKRRQLPSVAANLDAYEIEPERGFLPEPDPLDRLPEEFSSWETTARDLPKLLVTGRVRTFLNKLPVLDARKLNKDRERRRAMVVLSFLGHAYVWGEKEVVTSIPRCLAVPWHQVAQLLGRPPVLSYASYALDNWRRLDPERPIELGNIALRQNFLGGQDEEWFVLIHVVIEARAAAALAAALAAQHAVSEDRPEELTAQLTIVAETLKAMHQILLRMPERCDPYIYYHRVRPYLHGWANHPSLPSGIVYEGVKEYNNIPKSFRGETGAQSSIVPSLDAVLGIVHGEDLLLQYLKEMRDYMPPKHRGFIQRLEAGPGVRDYVLRRSRADAPLREAYNAAITGLERFRSTHLEYAHTYIVQQSQTGTHNPGDVGTGGTPFTAYLDKHRNETAQHLVR